MEFQELRLGNLCEYQTSERVIDTVSSNGDAILICKAGSHTTVSLKKCKPIPLTEEWLKKFGFKRKRFTNESHYALTEDFDFILDYGILCFRKQLTRIPSIKHVHQLQNLVFALTGSELNLEKIK